MDAQLNKKNRNIHDFALTTFYFQILMFFRRLSKHFLSANTSSRVAHHLKRDFSEIPVTQITKSNMAEHGCMGKSLGVIMQRLQEFAPLAYASSWDNVGLLVDPNIDAPIDTILLTNDLTEDIVEEAKCAKASLIISYHPNIFQGLKSVAKR